MKTMTTLLSVVAILLLSGSPAMAQTPPPLPIPHTSINLKLTPANVLDLENLQFEVGTEPGEYGPIQPMPVAENTALESINIERTTTGDVNVTAVVSTVHLDQDGQVISGNHQSTQITVPGDPVPQTVYVKVCWLVKGAPEEDRTCPYAEMVLGVE